MSYGCAEGLPCIVCDGEGMDEITMAEWAQIEMDFGWTKDDFDAEAELEVEAMTMSPQGIEGQTYEMPEILDDLPSGALMNQFVNAVESPGKPMVWLIRGYRATLGEGWKGYRSAKVAQRYMHFAKSSLDSITIFDDGTWSHGIHE